MHIYMHIYIYVYIHLLYIHMYYIYISYILYTLYIMLYITICICPNTHIYAFKYTSICIPDAAHIVRNYSWTLLSLYIKITSAPGPDRRHRGKSSRSRSMSSVWLMPIKVRVISELYGVQHLWLEDGCPVIGENMNKHQGGGNWKIVFRSC